MALQEPPSKSHVCVYFATYKCLSETSSPFKTIGLLYRDTYLGYLLFDQKEHTIVSERTVCLLLRGLDNEEGVRGFHQNPLLRI